MKLTSVFGFLALALAAIGLYGVTAYSVVQRTNEIGIRMALGADRRGILRMVLRSAFLQAGIGLTIGIPAAIFAGRFMASKLYNVRPADPAVLVATIVILGLAALLAAVISLHSAQLTSSQCGRSEWSEPRKKKMNHFVVFPVGESKTIWRCHSSRQ